MGTNYYAEINGEKLHVGKSSVGWHFAVRVYPERQINSLDDWLHMLRSNHAVITDEYGQSVSFTDLVAVITDRRSLHPAIDSVRELVWHGVYSSVENFLDANHAEFGLNGLVRSRIENFARGGCVGHGAGTWDYVVGEFS